MLNNKENNEQPKFVKIVYFDESAAQDYIDIENGGRLDWSKDENKERLGKIVMEIEAQAKSGFNIMDFIRTALSGNANGSSTNNFSKLLDTTLKYTLLTDYISTIVTDKNIVKFKSKEIYPPQNSVTIYKLYSSFLPIVPKEQWPIDMEKLNEAVLGDRGYYPMISKNEDNSESVLRFNITAFKNNYNLPDLPKMKLTYYGIKVGECTKEQLSIDKEFTINTENAKPKSKDILDGSTPKNDNLNVYDVVLAGIVCE